jgi:hypothetical protein
MTFTPWRSEGMSASLNLQMATRLRVSRELRQPYSNMMFEAGARNDLPRLMREMSGVARRTAPSNSWGRFSICSSRVRPAGKTPTFHRTGDSPAPAIAEPTFAANSALSQELPTKIFRSAPIGLLRAAETRCTARTLDHAGDASAVGLPTRVVSRGVTAWSQTASIEPTTIVIFGWPSGRPG